MDAHPPLRSRAQRTVDSPAARELVPLTRGESFRWAEHDYPAPMARWNYHPEIEIHLIRESSGSFIIGDRIGEFGPGHVAMVGSELPHDWMSDLNPGEVVVARDVVIQFTVGWLDKVVEVAPEMAELLPLIEASSRGIVYSGVTASRAAGLMESVGEAHGAARLGRLLELLALLRWAPDDERVLVVEKLYEPDVGRAGKAAVDAGLAYVLEHLAGDIRMAEAARLAHMSEPSFSRHFKSASGMTFSDLVRRLRIASACRLLAHSDASVVSISHSVGYRNLANFNRQFRAEMGMTPREYRNLDDARRPRVSLGPARREPELGTAPSASET